MIAEPRMRFRNPPPTDRHHAGGRGKSRLRWISPEWGTAFATETTITRYGAPVFIAPRLDRRMGRQERRAGAAQGSEQLLAPCVVAGGIRVPRISAVGLSVFAVVTMMIPLAPNQLTDASTTAGAPPARS